MGKRKKRISETPEERAAWQAKWDENTRRIEYYVERGKAELEAAKRKTAQP